MKRTSTVLMAVLALLFSIASVKEAKASDLGYSFDVLMGEGASISAEKPTCLLYSKEGKEVGTLTGDFSDPAKVTITFATNLGTLVVEEWPGDSINVPSPEDDSLMLSVGEFTRVISATGSFQHVTSVLHRCLYVVEGGTITRCINCLYAFIRG